MASATSGISKIKTYTGNAQQRRSGKGSSVTNHYKTQVTTLAGGGVKRETFRVDANGGNSVKISEVTTDKDGKITNDTVLPAASAIEKKSLKDPNSKLSREVKQQTKQAGDQAKKSSIDDTTDEAIDNAGGGGGNDAKTEEDEDSTTEAPESDLKSQNEETRDDFRKDLIYPLTLNPEFQDILKIDMVKYSPKAMGTGQFGNTFQDRRAITDGSNSNIIGTVMLPIPAGIQDQNTANWNMDQMDPVKSALANIAKTGMTQGLGAAVDTAGNTAQSAANNSGEVEEMIVGGLVNQALGTQNFLSRTKGAVVNPNMELLFLGPQLRSFGFSFKFSARSAPESDMIRDIIRFFKQGMSPIRSKSNLFLKAPHTFRLTYKNQNQDHIYLNRFKECALTNCAVQYTPEGQYATFHTGAMVSYQVNLTFQELEPIFNDDHGKADGNIGY
jgi:hypothetical protein